MKTTSPEPATARAARAVLTYLAEPADVLLGGLLRVADPREIVAAIPPGTGLGSIEARGVHLLCPGDPGWPGQLDDLGDQKVPLQLIMAKTGHRSPRTVMRCVRPGDAAVAKVTSLLGPPRRTH